MFLHQTNILLFSKVLLDEFIEVAERPKFRKYFLPDDVADLLMQVSVHAQFVTVTSKVNICRDPKDNFLFSLARHGKATHLITGGKDLLVLEQFEDTLIMTITEYLNKKQDH